MIESFEFPVVRQQIRRAVDWVVGGYENSISDGQITLNEFPTIQDLIEEIFVGVTNNRYYGDGEGPGPIPPIRDNPDPVLYKAMIFDELLDTDIVTTILNERAGWDNDD